MNTSNLAQRLDEFADTVERIDTPEPQMLRMVAVATSGTPRRAPRRLTLGTHRIQIRDAGLRYFRVY